VYKSTILCITFVKHSEWQKKSERSFTTNLYYTGISNKLCFTMKKISLWGNLLILIGITTMIAGISGISITYKSAARENIVTADDASIPGKPVRGPFTLKAQADVIRHHVLNTTGGLTYAEMPRQVPQLNDEGNVVLDSEGQPVMVANDRSIWITATTLMTALNLGVLSYGFSLFASLMGFVMIINGFVFRTLAKN
jgi:hypothetical protein